MCNRCVIGCHWACILPECECMICEQDRWERTGELIDIARTDCNESTS